MQKFSQGPDLYRQLVYGGLPEDDPGMGRIDVCPELVFLTGQRVEASHVRTEMLTASLVPSSPSAFPWTLLGPPDALLLPPAQMMDPVRHVILLSHDKNSICHSTQA